MTTQISSMSQTSVQKVVFILMIFTLVNAVSGIMNCYKGEYAADVRKDGAHKCLECPEDTYMDKHDHTEPNCFNCTAPSNDGSEKVIVECSKTHDAQIGCANGYYKHIYKDCKSCEKLWECSHCTKHCKHEGRPCSQTSNTVCCEYANMIVVDEPGGPRCVNKSKESSAEDKEDQSADDSGVNEKGTENTEDQPVTENSVKNEINPSPFTTAFTCCSENAATNNANQQGTRSSQNVSQENWTALYIVIGLIIGTLVGTLIFKTRKQCNLSGCQSTDNETPVRNTCSNGTSQECLEGSAEESNIPLVEITVEGRNHRELDNRVNEGTGFLSNPENEENRNGTKTKDHPSTQSNEDESVNRNGVLVVSES